MYKNKPDALLTQQEYFNTNLEMTSQELHNHQWIINRQGFLTFLDISKINVWNTSKKDLYWQGSSISFLSGLFRNSNRLDWFFYTSRQYVIDKMYM